ncbi:MAG: hypothetical protein KTR31_20795 [Myxococcales bacterium]|nr:hypothetical protein [Myxococcales bacterium]
MWFRLGLEFRGFVDGLDKPLAIQVGDRVLMVDDTVVSTRAEMMAALAKGASRLVISGSRDWRHGTREVLQTVDLSTLHPQEIRNGQCERPSRRR